jgi:hypothetical protein
MTPEELKNIANSLETSKAELRKKKLERNKVRVIEEKQAEIYAKPVVNELKKLEDNKLIEENMKDELKRFVSSNNANFRFSTNGILNGTWRYVKSNSENFRIKVVSVEDPTKSILIQCPNQIVFLLFFKAPNDISGVDSEKLYSFIQLINEMLGIDFSNNSTLKRYISDKKRDENLKTMAPMKASAGTPVRTSGTSKRSLGPKITSLLGPSTAAASPIATGYGLPKIGKGVNLTKHGNLLLNNQTLMKKLYLNIQEQVAGNTGVRKDISMLLDEALKRGLLDKATHKKSMKDYVLP